MSVPTASRMSSFSSSLLLVAVHWSVSRSWRPDQTAKLATIPTIVASTNRIETITRRGLGLLCGGTGLGGWALT